MLRGHGSIENRQFPAVSADYEELISRGHRDVPVHIDLQSQAQLVRAVLQLGGRPD